MHDPEKFQPVRRNSIAKIWRKLALRRKQFHALTPDHQGSRKLRLECALDRFGSAIQERGPKPFSDSVCELVCMPSVPTAALAYWHGAQRASANDCYAPHKPPLHGLFNVPKSGRCEKRRVASEAPRRPSRNADLLA